MCAICTRVWLILVRATSRKLFNLEDADTGSLSGFNRYGQQRLFLVAVLHLACTRRATAKIIPDLDIVGAALMNTKNKLAFLAAALRNKKRFSNYRRGKKCKGHRPFNRFSLVILNTAFNGCC